MEVNGHFNDDDLQPAYRTQKVCSKPASWGADGLLVSDMDEQRACWAEDFELLYTIYPSSEQL